MSVLFNFRPLVVNPELAVRIGLNEAIVLQQLKYWLNETDSGVEYDGRQWVYNTLDQWQKQFPFWSVDTVKRALTSLQNQELVFAEKLNKAQRDQTNYYAINYLADALMHEGNLPSSTGANCPDQKRADCPDEKRANCPPLHTENTTKTTSPKAKRPVAAIGLDTSAFPEQPSPDIWADYQKYRKNKRAAINQTIINQLAKELQQAVSDGWTVDDALAEAMAAGWQGLKASWLANRSKPGAGAQGMSRQSALEARNQQALKDFIGGDR